MFVNRTHKRRAISAVLTTIVILVASIVLGAGVVVYSTSLFQTGGQQQSVSVQGIKTWVNATYASGSGGPGGGIGWGSFSIKNTGDKLLSVTSISIRGTQVPFTNWYADSDAIRVGQNFQAQFNYTKNDINGNLKGSAATGIPTSPVQGGNAAACVQSAAGTNPPTEIVIQEAPYQNSISPLCLAQQSGPVTLNPGSSAIFYYKLPLNLFTPTDSGVTSTVSLLAGNAPVAQTVRVANP
jgi:hypothetical protein